MGPDTAPASELAALYSQRWEIESLFDELNTHLNESRRVLRSQSPELVYQELVYQELVYQEIWGMLGLHYAIRALMCEAAETIGADPDRLSFLGTLRAIRRTMTASPSFPVRDSLNPSKGQFQRFFHGFIPSAGCAAILGWCENG